MIIQLTNTTLDLFINVMLMGGGGDPTNSKMNRKISTIFIFFLLYNVGKIYITLITKNQTFTLMEFIK